MIKLKSRALSIHLGILILGLICSRTTNAVIIDWNGINQDGPSQYSAPSTSPLENLFDGIPKENKSLSHLSVEERYSVMLSALQTGEIEGAIALSKELTTAYKNDIHIAAINSISTIQAGNYSQAKKQLKQLQAKDKFEKASVLLAKALLSIALHNYQEGNAQLSDLISIIPKHGYAFVLTAHIASVGNKPEEAVAAINQALTHFPNMRIALNNAGQLALTSGKYSLAINYFDRLLANNGKCTARNGKAQALLSLNQYSKIHQTLKPCLGNQANTQSIILTATALSLLKQYDQSWSVIQASINKTNLPELSLAAGRIALKRGDIKNALKYSSGINPNQIFLNSLTKLASGKYNDAEKQLSPLLSQNKKSDLVRIALASSQILQNKKNITALDTISKDSVFYPMASLLQANTPGIKSNEAVKHFYNSQSISSNLTFDNVPKTTIHTLLLKANKEASILGSLFYLLDNPALSKKYLARAVRKKEDFLSSYLLALTLSQARQFSEAEPNIRQALKTLSSSFTAQYLLADLLMKQNKLKPAVDEFQKALQIKPDAFAALKAGAISERLERFEQAESFYREAIRTLPDNFAVYNQLAWFFASQNKNLDEGIELAQKALQLSPGSPNIMDTLGWLYYKKGDLNLAHATLSKAQASNSSHSVLFHLAIIEKELGHSKRSASLFEQILNDPLTSSYTKKAKAELEKNKGK